jgi:hypothetical protein
LDVRLESIIDVVPALFVDKDDANFILARAMFALLFTVLLVFLIAMRLSRSAIASPFSRAAASVRKRPTT